MPPDPLPDPLALAIRFLREIADRKYQEPADNQEVDAGHWARAHALQGLHRLELIAEGITGEERRRDAMRLFGLSNAQKAALTRPRDYQAEAEGQRQRDLRRKAKRSAE